MSQSASEFDITEYPFLVRNNILNPAALVRNAIKLGMIRPAKPHVGEIRCPCHKKAMTKLEMLGQPEHPVSPEVQAALQEEA